MQNAQCKYYQVSRAKSKIVSETYKTKLLDIEEWCKEGSTEKFCPYYSNRSLVESAQLVILPFEALYDEAQMALLRAYTKDSIVVIEDVDFLQDMTLEVASLHPQYECIELSSKTIQTTQTQLDELQVLPSSDILAALSAAVGRADQPIISASQLATSLCMDNLDSKLLTEIDTICDAITSMQQQKRIRNRR